MKITVISFLFLLIISCKEKTHNRNEFIYHFDVKNDSLKETLIVEKDLKKKSNSNIYILQQNKRIKICSILPTNDEGYSTKSPEIENVYLEANDVQTYTKGFRIIIRNTDMSPDIMYLDLYFDKEWFVKTFGIISTGSESKQFICSRNINRSLNSFKGYFGKEIEITPTMFISLYFGGNMDCRE